MCQEGEQRDPLAQAHLWGPNRTLDLSRGRLRKLDGSLKQWDFFNPPGEGRTELVIKHSTVKLRVPG